MPLCNSCVGSNGNISEHESSDPQGLPIEENDKIQNVNNLIRLRKEEYRKSFSNKDILPKPNSGKSHGKKRKLLAKSKGLNLYLNTDSKLKTLDTFWRKAGFSLAKNYVET